MITLGHIKNIPVEIDNSWVLIFVFLTWSLAVSYFPAGFSSWTTLEYWSVGAATSLIFFACVLFHELGHSFVALHYKIPVREITLYFFGGVSQITKEPSNAAMEFWIALAGPLVSFGLGIIFFLLGLLTKNISPLRAIAQYLAYINIILGVFNLIPGFPLDGGRVFQAIWWGISHNLRQATNAAVFIGQTIAFLFIVLGIWQIFSGNLSTGIWITFMGWFLDMASLSQKQRQNIQDILSEHQVFEAISRNYVIIPADITLQKLADDHILGMGKRFFILQDETNKVCGILTLSDITRIPREKWPVTSAYQIMVPADKMHQVQKNTNLWEALQKMDQDGVNQQPVLENGELQGILSRDGIISFLRSHQPQAQSAHSLRP